MNSPLTAFVTVVSAIILGLILIRVIALVQQVEYNSCEIAERHENNKYC